MLVIQRLPVRERQLRPAKLGLEQFAVARGLRQYLLRNKPVGAGAAFRIFRAPFANQGGNGLPSFLGELPRQLYGRRILNVELSADRLLTFMAGDLPLERTLGKSGGLVCGTRRIASGLIGV